MDKNTAAALENFGEVWERVCGKGSESGGTGGDALGALREFIADEACAAAFYAACAQRGGRFAARLRELERDERAHLRTLQGEYFLLTGEKCLARLLPPAPRWTARPALRLSRRARRRRGLPPRRRGPRKRGPGRDLPPARLRRGAPRRHFERTYPLRAVKSNFLLTLLKISFIICGRQLNSIGSSSAWRCRVVGRARTIGNRVRVKSPSRVRISPSPPRRSKVRFAPALFYACAQKNAIRPLPCSSSPSRTCCAGLRLGFCDGLSKVRFAPTLFYACAQKNAIRPLPCSSSPSRTCCAGLRLGFCDGLSKVRFAPALFYACARKAPGLTWPCCRGIFHM